MWTFISERLPNSLGWFLVAMSLAIPWLIYKVNRVIRQYGDPPWKKEADKGK